MRLVLTVLITAVVTSLFWNGIYLSKGRNTADQMILLEDSLLKTAGGEIVGRIPAGTILHEPGFSDTHYTEPFDPRIYKIFVEFGATTVETDLVRNHPGNGEAPVAVFCIEPGGD